MHRKAQDKSRMGFKLGGPTSSVTQLPVRFSLRRLEQRIREHHPEPHPHCNQKYRNYFILKWTQNLSLGKFFFFKVLLIKDGNF